MHNARSCGKIFLLMVRRILTRDELREVLIEVLGEIQELSGEEVPEISDDTWPMADLADFDSLSAIEATTQLSERLSQELDPRLFWSKEGTPLKIGDIVYRIYQTISVEEGGRRG